MQLLPLEDLRVAYRVDDFPRVTREMQRVHGRPWGARAVIHVHFTGVNTYLECRCGHRTYRSNGAGHQPVDRAWLAGADWR